jgi:hypothetical protein
MKMFDKKIKDTKDVADFFWHLLTDHNLSFHPDDDFRCYVNHASGKKVYTEEMVYKYNALMQDCFTACKIYGTDIYSTGIEQLNEYHKMLAGKKDIRPITISLEGNNLEDIADHASHALEIVQYSDKSVDIRCTDCCDGDGEVLVHLSSNTEEAK